MNCVRLMNLLLFMSLKYTAFSVAKCEGELSALMTLNGRHFTGTAGYSSRLFSQGTTDLTSQMTKWPKLRTD